MFLLFHIKNYNGVIKKLDVFLLLGIFIWSYFAHWETCLL